MSPAELVGWIAVIALAGALAGLVGLWGVIAFAYAREILKKGTK